MVGGSRAGVDEQLAQHLCAEPVERENAADRAAHDLGRQQVEERAERLAAGATRVVGVPHVDLVRELLAGDLDLAGVNHDARVAGTVKKQGSRKAVTIPSLGLAY